MGTTRRGISLEGGRKVRRLASRKSRHRRSPTGDGDRPTPPPSLDPQLAYRVVQLLHAGLPLWKAIVYVVPEADERQVTRLATTWGNSPELLRAVSRFSRGEWPDLSPEDRLTLARDKYLAELAHSLYTRSFETAGDDLGKMKYAYAVIAQHLASLGTGETNPMADFLKDLAEGKADEGPDPVIPAGDTLADARVMVKKEMN